MNLILVFAMFAAPVPDSLGPFKPGIVYVNVVSNKGHNVKDCANKAIDVAKRLRCHVGFLHDGIQLIVTPEDTAVGIEKRWEEHRVSP